MRKFLPDRVKKFFYFNLRTNSLLVIWKSLPQINGRFLNYQRVVECLLPERVIFPNFGVDHRVYLILEMVSSFRIEDGSAGRRRFRMDT